MFLCRYCIHQTEQLVIHLKHYRSHSSFSNDFHCGYDGCKYFFKTEANLRMHIIRQHHIFVKHKVPYFPQYENKNINAQFVCSEQLCEQSFYDYARFLKHLKDHIRNGVIIKCPVTNCEKNYDNIQSFTGHLSKCHRQYVKNKSQILIETNQLNIVDSEQENEKLKNDSYNNSSTEIDNYDSIQSNTDKNFLYNLANLYLKLESQYLVPASTLQYLVIQLSDIYNQSREIISNILSECLSRENLSSEKINLIVAECHQADPFCKSNKILKSKFRRKNFYKLNYHYVEPQKVLLRTVNKKEQFFYYVPIEDTIIAMHNDKSLEGNFDYTSQSKENFLHDFTDGSVYSENEFFINNPNALRIILYQDSFEVANPLGSAKKKYKMLAVYMSIGNLPDYIRTHIDSIQLVALCKESEFDHHKVYGRIVDDIKNLEIKGVDVAPNVNKKAGVVFITGDNLGSHELGGFTQNFSSSTYCCRYCLFKRTKLTRKLKSFKALGKQKNAYLACNKKKVSLKYNSNTKSKKLMLAKHNNQKKLLIDDTAKSESKYVRNLYVNRTIQLYKESIEKIKQNNLNEHNGVKFDSVFNQLQSFHVCSPGLPPCLGHDLLEGIVAYDLQLLITNLIKKKWFTCDQLNNKINTFNYSTTDSRDKPTNFNIKGNRISGGAWQVWCFLRLFPLFIYNYIKDPSDPVWKTVLLLSEITELVCAPSMNKSYLPYLEDIIHEYLSFRLTIFPSVPLRPKHHFLTHYPELFIKFGPLIKVWTLRFESKHTFFKRVIRAIHNFLNIGFSLSEKHELFQSLNRMGSNLRYAVCINNETTLKLAMFSDSIQKVILDAKLSEEIQQCSSVVVKGTHYKNDDAVILKQEAYQHNVAIGKILLILCDEMQNIFFVVENSTTIFHPIIRFYEMKPTKKYELINTEQLLDHTPHFIYQIGNMKGIKLHHGI